jgi:glycosyltransferase involved in cell wall biosynthesis
MTIRVAVYMICKDESRFIERAVKSAAKADEIVVCDTGSTDDTLTKLKALNLPNLKVYSINISPWRFDDARNAALALVDPTIDLCISLDADEVLSDGFIEALQALEGVQPLTQINHSFMTNWTWEQPNAAPSITRHFHERIHSRIGFRWIHPVHEKLVARTAINVLWMTDLLMIQYPDASKSRSSYLYMLEQAVLEDPTDWKLWSFMAQEYADRRQYDRVDYALNKAAECPNVDQVFIAWRRGGNALARMKTDEAEMHYMTAAMRAPNLREAWIMLADLYHSQARADDEMFALIRALKCTTETQGYLRSEAAWNGSLEARLNKLQQKVA